MIIEKESPDLINFNHYGNPYLWFIKLFFHKTKLVNTVHDVNPNHGDGNLLHKIWFSLSNKLSDAIIVLCDYNRRLMEKSKVSTKIYTSKLGSINSYNTDNNFKLCEDNNALFFGRIRRYKGLKYLLNAIPIIMSEIPEVINPPSLSINFPAKEKFATPFPSSPLHTMYVVLITF